MKHPPEILPAEVKAPWPSRGTPAVVAGTWDSARKWRDAAAAMERAKLFCQVMLGFELIALRAAIPNEMGKRTDRTSCHDDTRLTDRTSCHDDTRLTDRTSCHDDTRWAELLERELRLSMPTAYRIMRMAKAAAPRLRKLPALRGFDPSAQVPAALPRDTQAALEAAVKKLTDGLTQVEFMQELGLAKMPQGAGATGRPKGQGGREPLGASDELHLRRQTAREDWQEIEARLLGSYLGKFKLLSDPEVEAQLASLEQSAKARREWLRIKPEHRDHDPEEPTPKAPSKGA